MNKEGLNMKNGAGIAAMIVMIPLCFLAMFLLVKLMKFSMNGEKGIDYIITRAELTGDANRIARDSGWVRLSQPVIEILLCATLSAAVLGVMRIKTEVPFLAWMQRHGLPVSLGLMLLLAGFVLATRRAIARQMEDEPLKMERPAEGKTYTVIGLVHPGRVLALSGGSVIFVLLAGMFAIGLSSRYVNRGTMICLMVASLALAALCLWTAYKSRREAMTLLTIGWDGIRIRPTADGQGGVLIPLESVRGTDLSLDGKQLVFRVADAEGGREKRVPVSIENSLIREKTIRRILDLYLLAVRKDAREAVDGDGPSVL